MQYLFNHNHILYLLRTCHAIMVTTLPLHFALMGPALGIPNSHSQGLPVEHFQSC